MLLLLALTIPAAAASTAPPSAAIRKAAPNVVLIPDVNRVEAMPVLNPNPSSRSCPPTSRYEAARRGGKLKFRRLNQLPMADAYSAVYRRIGGCPAPIIVKYGVGGH